MTHTSDTIDWRILAGREQGTSHVDGNTPCEDYFFTAQIGDTQCVLVADGSGSARCGGEGAKIACETAMALAQSRDFSNENFPDDFPRDCVIAIQQAISARCEDDDAPRDFACTFLVLLAKHDKTLCFQVGDGAMVLDNGEGLFIAIEPIQGEYANMTHFVSDENALDNLVVATFPRAEKFAVLTDGLQRLALNLQANTPHEPFFKPFFEALLQSPKTEDDALQTALYNFLSSESVNARTDDDKTLVLGVVH